ncbi:MAG TPA: preprotein translocase subunit YajC [Rikenellaceae bacterium]|nr:preprotein translocase subunit YajC [Bacteroidales bacterium]HAC41583.1 preprotein translocase subunit YajC [Rikenellaceae bacterium]
MNLLSAILLMGPAAAPAGADGQQPSAWPTIIMFGAIILVMWLFMIRPQRKQQKELQNFRSGLKKGDKVVTVGGIYGEIVEVNEKTCLIKVDGDVKLRVDKQGLVKDYSETAQQ